MPTKTRRSKKKKKKIKKKFSKLEIEENFLNLINSINKKPTVNILNGGRPRGFPLGSGTRENHPGSPSHNKARKRNKKHSY